MDTSETYIKMCEKAEEIQKLKPKVIRSWDEIGSWFLDDRGDLVCFDSIGVAYKWWSESGRKTIAWLPRQDQLQEMVGGYEAGFIDWWHWRNAIYPEMQNPLNTVFRFSSFEQLWLAFVMKEKYNKVWGKEEWINDNA